MDKIILNNGKYDKINKEKLKKNIHSLSLLTEQYKEFYNISIKDLPFTRFLNDLPRLKYHQMNLSVNFKKSIHHIGQRKLLLGELEFLTIMYNKYDLFKYNKVICLYIGAGPGSHLKFFEDKFKNLKWHLYDPGSFTLKENNKFKIFNSFFTDKDINKYKNKKYPVLFISDIRNPKFKDKFDFPVIKKDMEFQKKIVKEIKPFGAILKFRLDFNFGKLKYLYGDIYLQNWSSVNSTETRLICNKDDSKNYTKEIIYNNDDYNDKLFYFNHCYRMNLFKHNVNNINCLCHCYDCTSEIYIIANYLNLLNKNVYVSQIKEIIEEINKCVFRNLCSENLNIEDKIKKFKKRYENISDEEYEDYEKK